MCTCVCLPTYAVERLASLWRASEKEVMTEDCAEFKEYYDDVQDKIGQISILDELLAGAYHTYMYTCICIS